MGRVSLAPQRQEEILDAFERLLPSKGLAVSFKEIAAEAGMATSIISHYFGSRSELQRALTERAVERHRGEFMAAVDGLGGDDRVDALIEFMFGGAWTELCRRDFHIPALFAEARQDAATRDILRDGFDVFESTVRDVLESARPRAAAATIDSVAYGLMCLSRSHEDFMSISHRDPGRRTRALHAARALAAALAPRRR